MRVWCPFFFWMNTNLETSPRLLRQRKTANPSIFERNFMKLRREPGCCSSSKSRQSDRYMNIIHHSSNFTPLYMVGISNYWMEVVNQLKHHGEYQPEWIERWWVLGSWSIGPWVAINWWRALPPRKQRLFLTSMSCCISKIGLMVSYIFHIQP